MSDELFTLALDAERPRAALQLRLAPLRAVAASHDRHDAVAEATRAAAGVSVACRRGCAFCCQFRVSARAVEVLRLAAWIRDHLPDAYEEIAAAAAANAAILRRLAPERRMRVNLPCPLLADAACRAWEARPLACRAFHATDAEGCRDSVEDPERDDIPPALIPAVDAVSRGHAEAFARGLAQAGLDDHLYELNAALAQALSDGPTAGPVSFPGARFSD